MGFPIEEKLVIGIASSALFDLSESDAVYRKSGENAYRQYQREHVDDTLAKGVAFPFIQRLLNLNEAFPDEQPVEVILMSRNDPDTGLRVFRSIDHYGLNITRAVFTAGGSPHLYIPAFNVSLFLSADEASVYQAIEAGFAAGLVLPSAFEAEQSANKGLCIAFDFDGVLASDEAEQVYKREGLEAFKDSEESKKDIPLMPGPLQSLCRQISQFQRLERARAIEDCDYEKLLKVTLVTARSAPSHERVVTTLNSWGISPDETFFMGGVDKTRVLEIMQPHIFFDDQLAHLTSSALKIPSVHVPFGLGNIKKALD